MDSFVDKLAQRFNAGEMIRANAEAEAQEIARLKAQAEEYDKTIQEMRRLHLKTVELSEQISQLVQCGIEQLESYHTNMEQANESAAGETEAIKSVLLESFDEQKKLLEQLHDKQAGFLREAVESQHEALNAGMEKHNEVLNVNMQMAADNQRDSMKRLEERMMAMRAAIEESLTDMENSLRAGVKDYEPMLQALNTGILTNKGVYEENANQLKEMIVKVRLLLDEQQKQMLDYVHKENVKVYRNVQAVVNDQTNLRAKELADRLDTIEKRTKGKGVLLGLTFLTAAASVAIQVLQLLGIL